MRLMSGAAERRVSPPCPETAWRPLPTPLHEVTATPSRHAQPRAWLRAVNWLIGAGLHPRAGARTLEVARDLAARMDYTRGLVLYDLDGTARRLRVHRATVKRHVAILRQLGALAWWRHGTRRNLHLPGRRYAGTATIYAATIPPAFDHAMGHRLEGRGYTARVAGITEVGRERAVTEARSTARPVDNSPVENHRSQARAPHSLTGSPNAPVVDVGGGLKDTSRIRATRRKTSTRPNTNPRRSGGALPDTSPRTPRQVEQEMSVTRRIRARVNWLQRIPLRKLNVLLRWYYDQHRTETQIVSDLYAACMSWRPTRPAAYLAAVLKRHAQGEHEEREARQALHQAVAPSDNAAWAAALHAFRSSLPAPVRTDDDRRAARLDWNRWPDVLHHYETDPDDALDLYGQRLVEYAVRQGARTTTSL